MPSTSPPRMTCWPVGSTVTMLFISPPSRYRAWKATSRKAANASAHPFSPVMENVGSTAGIPVAPCTPAVRLRSYHDPHGSVTVPPRRRSGVQPDDGLVQVPETVLLKKSAATAIPSAFPTFPDAAVRLKEPPLLPEACPAASSTAIMVCEGTENSVRTPRQPVPVLVVKVAETGPPELPVPGESGVPA